MIQKEVRKLPEGGEENAFILREARPGIRPLSGSQSAGRVACSRSNRATG